MARLGKTLLRVLGLPLLGLAWVGAATPAPAAQEDRLAFKVMLSSYLGQTGQLHQNASGRLEVRVDGQAWGVFWVTRGGRLDFSIPADRTAEWELVTDAHSVRHFRSEFQDGQLKILNLDRDGRAVRYYLTEDGSYALEYYQDWLYISNQGQPDAPILGWLRWGRLLKPKGVGTAAVDPGPPGGRLLPQVVPTITGINPNHGQVGTIVQITGTDFAQGAPPKAEFNGVVATMAPAGYTNTQMNVYAPAGAGTVNVVVYAQPSAGVWHGPSNVVNFTYDAANPDLPPSPPDRMPSGGLEDLFGAPAFDEILGDLLDHIIDLPGPDQTSLGFNQGRRDGQSFGDNRVLAFSEGTDPGAGEVGPQRGGLPGLAYQWVYAGSRQPETWFLPLGADGKLPTGVTWSTLLATARNDVKQLLLLLDFPPDFLKSLEPGTHRLKYWLEDADGNKSNVRTEEIIIN